MLRINHNRLPSHVFSTHLPMILMKAKDAQWLGLDQSIE